MKEKIEKTLNLWYIPLILGIVFSLAGIAALTTPVATFITFSVIIAIGFIVSGIIEAVLALRNRKWTKGWGWYFFGAILSITAGFILFANPALTLLLFSLYVGFWILFRSVTEIGVSFDLKRKGENNGVGCYFSDFLV